MNKIKLATKMNNGVRKNCFNNPAWQARKQARHLKELRKRKISYSYYYRCDTGYKLLT